MTASGQAVIYTKRVADPRAAETMSAARQRYWGCLRSTGVVRRVVDTEPWADGASTTARSFRIGGHFTAFVVMQLDHYGGRSASVTAADLSGARGNRSVYVGDGQQGGPGGPERPLAVRSLKVSRSGAVAWIVRSTLTYFGPLADRLATFDTSQAQRTLDVAAPGTLTGLHLDRRTLRWRRAGHDRAAMIAPFWDTNR